MAVIGHNGGPTLAAGHSWRRQCWTAARAQLLPVLPVEVVRLRVNRARQLGLDYKTYAGVRAATGHDLVAFLFSSNALQVDANGAVLSADRAAKLENLADCGRIGLAVAPLDADALMRAAPALDRADPAPWALASFRDTGIALRRALGALPGDRVLLIGDHMLERDWCAAGRLAGYLPSERFFAMGRP